VKDDLRICGGSSGHALAEAIARHLDVEASPVISRKLYNDNTFVQVRDNVRESDVFVVQTSCPPVNDHLVELLMLIDALKGASARRVTAVVPHMPYQQSDKKDEPRICITAKLVANMIRRAGADRVLTLDLHAAQIQGFFDCAVDHLTAVPILCDYFLSQEIPEIVAVATDVGRAQMVRRYARRMNVPLAIIDKQRVSEVQVRALNVIGEVQGRNAIIFDDLIGTGGSLIEAARLLKEHGVRDVYAGAVHGVLAGGAVQRLEESVFRQVVVTDSVPVQDKLAPGSKFRVLSVAGLLAKAIRHIHEGESVSALFV
jgi:ribose-phosphate pyrophosphokinase